MAGSSDSFWKPPVLKAGEYDWWAEEMEAHVCSLDGQLWRVIEQGPLPIVDENKKEKKRENYSDADYKALEKNNRAKKVLHHALNDGDRKKVMGYKTAKEMWDALKRLYGGNEDIKRNRILAASKDYESIMQGKSESLEEFHSRFQGLVGQLKFLGEDIPEWKVTHHFMQALNSKWDSVTTALQAQTDIKTVTLEELVARLQSNAGVIQRKIARREPDRERSIALKIEKAFDIMQSDEPIDEDVDAATALITRAIKFAAKGNFNKPRRNDNPKPEPEEPKPQILCYRCKKKGHRAKDCRVKLPDSQQFKQNNKAMVAAWGSDEESEEDGGEEETCLMALSGNSSPKVKSSDICAETYNNLLFALKELTTEHERMLAEKEKLEEEIAGHVDNNQLWANEALRLEKELAESKCKTCEKAQSEVKIINKTVETLQDEIGKLATEKSSLTENNKALKEDKEKLVTLTRSLEEKVSSLESEKEQLLKTMEELKADDETKRKAWLDEQQNTRDVEKKQVNPFKPGLGLFDEHVQLSATNGGTIQKRGTKKKKKQGTVPPHEHPFVNDEEVAYQLWLKMARNKAKPKVDLEHVKKNQSVPAGWSKYVYLKEHMVCWYCGKSGHLIKDCPLKTEIVHIVGTKKKGRKEPSPPRNAQPRKVQYVQVPHEQNRFRGTRKGPVQHTRMNPTKNTLGKAGGKGPYAKPRKTPRTKIELTNNTPDVFPATSTSFVKPSKPKLVWVRKN